ncbi:MAG: response regulator [Candidatus Obscuribacterales bacterium]|jgi:two-component system, sensor histidine kinase|nr:response regulator [Candidatus Obscuribacterales bacterium]
MDEKLKELFSGSGFMPHGYCLQWDENLLLTMIIANLAIALAYFAIPTALLYFAGKRKDLAYPWMFRLFGAFIVACGMTHVMKVVTLYKSLYWLESLVDAYTALISLVTAFLLWPLIPKALSLPSPRQLEKVNAELEIARDKATEASNLKSLFIANISHELRTPLSAILGMNELLLNSKLNQEQNKIAQTIQEAGQSLLTVVNDLLDISKIEAGKISIVNSPLSVQTIVNESMSIFEIQAQNKMLQFSSQIDPAIPTQLFGDTIRLKQILVNLIGNAVKFTEAGKVNVSVNLLSKQDDMLTLEFIVSDTGIGLSTDAQSKLFTPFTQGDTSTSRKYGGAGLGLAISKHLVELMNGRLTVSSNKDIGSTFCFSIPLPTKQIDDSESNTDQPFEPEALFWSKPIVLVVEDDLLLQKLIKNQLNKLNIEATVLGDGLSALKSLDHQTYDLIFMDCHLPGMDGFVTTAKIREQEDLAERKTPIIAMTADAMLGDKERCLAAGMNDYLSKPYTLQQLQDKITKWYEPISLFDYQAFKTEFSNKEMNSILLAFIANGEDLISSLQAANQHKNFAELSSITHRFKGSASMIHALALANNCLELERAAKAEDSELVDKRLSVLQLCFDQTKEQLQRLAK